MANGALWACCALGWQHTTICCLEFLFWFSCVCGVSREFHNNNKKKKEKKRSEPHGSQNRWIRKTKVAEAENMRKKNTQIDWLLSSTDEFIHSLSFGINRTASRTIAEERREKVGREEGTLYMPLRRIFRQTQSTHSPHTLASEAIYCSWAVTGSCYALPAGREGGAEV